MVVDPGDYRFLDFVNVGFPILLVTFVITLILTPIFFPL